MCCAGARQSSGSPSLTGKVLPSPIRLPSSAGEKILSLMHLSCPHPSVLFMFRLMYKKIVPRQAYALNNPKQSYAIISRLMR